jgi:hypothetical protein
MERVRIDATGEGLGFFAKLRMDAAEPALIEEDTRSVRSVVEMVSRTVFDVGWELDPGIGRPLLGLDAQPFFLGDFYKVLTAASPAIVAAPVLSGRYVKGRDAHGVRVIG